MDTRTDNILNMGEAFDNLKTLKLDIQGILKQIAITTEHVTILQAQKADLEAALAAKQAEVIEETLCIDRALSALYPAAPAPAPAPEPKKRGRKGKEDVVQEQPDPIKASVEETQGTAPATPILPVAANPCTACHAASHCDDCCKECMSGCDTKQECRKNAKEPQHEAASQKAEAEGAETPAPGAEGDPVGVSAEPAACQKCEGEGWYTGDDGEVNCDCEAGKALTHREQTALADVPEIVSAVAAAVSFMPLDEPLGDCELCMGYGVIDGELYGEPTLVPCTCQAGLKVKGEPERVKCCEDCNIEDPACADCHLPDMDAPLDNDPSQLPRCASGPCTATGKKPKDTCLRASGKECRNFVPVEKCKHWVHKQAAHPDGSITCDLCDQVVKEAPAAEPNTLQKRCTHPKPFRMQTPEGEVCKVCKTNLSEPSLFAA